MCVVWCGAWRWNHGKKKKKTLPMGCICVIWSPLASATSLPSLASPRHQKLNILCLIPHRDTLPVVCFSSLLSCLLGGFIWTEIKQMWDGGFHDYIHDWWNLMDFVMNSLYLATISLKIVAYMKVRSTVCSETFAVCCYISTPSVQSKGPARSFKWAFLRDEKVCFI